MKAILSILLLTWSFFIRDKNDLPIKKIQVIGSYNSYKQAIDPLLFKALRNLEIDVYADAKGDKYSHPKGLEWAKGQHPYDVAHEMNEPGFKILHVPDLDFRSHALTFKGVLQQLRKWFEAHPDHTPVPF